MYLLFASTVIFCFSHQGMVHLPFNIFEECILHSHFSTLGEFWLGKAKAVALCQSFRQPLDRSNKDRPSLLYLEPTTKAPPLQCGLLSSTVLPSQEKSRARESTSSPQRLCCLFPGLPNTLLHDSFVILLDLKFQHALKSPEHLKKLQFSLQFLIKQVWGRRLTMYISNNSQALPMLKFWEPYLGNHCPNHIQLNQTVHTHISKSTWQTHPDGSFLITKHRMNLAKLTPVSTVHPICWVAEIASWLHVASSFIAIGFPVFICSPPPPPPFTTLTLFPNSCCLVCPCDYILANVKSHILTVHTGPFSSPC